MIPTLVGQIGLLRNIVSDPLSVVLLVIGALLVAFSAGLFGYLSFRAILAAIIPEPSRAPPQQGQ